MNNTVVETKTCAHCQSHFDITQGDMNFYDKISPTLAGEKFQIPTPTLCPDCRQRRRLSFRNEHKLYRRQCDASQKSIISIYSPDKPYKVYDQKIWRSDSRDPMDYGMNFDFSKSFTENFRGLIMSVPLASQFNTNSENSEYCNHVGGMKNCYLCSASRNCSDTFYSSKTFETQDSSDILNSSNLQYCYQNINSVGCHHCDYIIDCNNCSDSSYLINCEGCTECFMCTGLVNKKYFYKNKQYSQNEYQELIGKHKIKGWNGFSVENITISENRGNSIVRSENCTGHKISDSFNCQNCYNITNSNNCKNIENGGEICENVYDGFGIGYEQNLAYEIVDTGLKSYKNLFCFVSQGNREDYYIFCCYNSSNLFGCIGLRNKQYCIFNKQYTKEEYEIIVAKIIQHMMATGERGEFFHPSLSPFGYNETVAQEYYPINQGELKEFGYKWSNYKAPTPQVDKVIKGQDLPETIQEVSDDILKVAVICEISGKPFRIIPQELAFYRKHNIPLPKKHPDVRHLERMVLRK